MTTNKVWLVTGAGRGIAEAGTEDKADAGHSRAFGRWLKEAPQIPSRSFNATD